MSFDSRDIEICHPYDGKEELSNNITIVQTDVMKYKKVFDNL
jgi:hypothetical protein